MAIPRAVRGQIRPYVSDTPNLLLRATVDDTDEDFLHTLAYSLRRAIQLDYQVEEQETQIELIGTGQQRRIILWEGAEGGIGVWERLIEEPPRFCWARADRSRSPAFRSSERRGKAGLGSALPGSLLRLSTELRQPARSPPPRPASGL
jgi:hypothetical protein